VAVAGKSAAPEAQKPLHALKPLEGYYDEGFTIEPGGARLALIRTDGATFSKLEIIDLKTGQVADSTDLGQSDRSVEAAELLPNGAGTLLTIRDLSADRLSATVVDAAGRAGAKTQPAVAFGRSELADGKGGSESVVIAMDKKGVARFGIGGEVT
jgi:hypothetical protein